MKVFVVYFNEQFDCTNITKILGAYSSNEKAIERVRRFEYEEVDDLFSEGERDKMGYVVCNHNNGYLNAYLNYDFHEVTINTKEIEVDSDIDWAIEDIS